MLPNGWDFLFLEPQNRRLNNQFDLTFGLCWNMSSSPNQDSRLVWILEILSCKKIMITKWSLTNPIHQNLCDYFVICINLALLEPAPSNILPFTLNQLILYCLHLFFKKISVTIVLITHKRLNYHRLDIVFLLIFFTIVFAFKLLTSSLSPQVYEHKAHQELLYY